VVKQKIISNNAKTEGVKKCIQCFKISRSTPTKRILDALIQTAETHDWGGSNITPELGKYLKALTKKTPSLMKKYRQATLKFIQKTDPPQSMEVTKPEDMPLIPSSIPPQSEPTEAGDMPLIPLSTPQSEPTDKPVEKVIDLVDLSPPPHVIDSEPQPSTSQVDKTD
jgi:hypothetical protein